MPASTTRKAKKPVYQPVLKLPPLSYEDFVALRDNIAVNGVLVPIMVDCQGPRRKIIDGNYRKAIADELGYDCPEIVHQELSADEMRTLARAMNLARRQLNTVQKRQLVSDQLRETPDRTNRWIGKQLGVHHATVASVRAELAPSVGQNSQLGRRIGSDGKSYKASKTPSGPGKRVFQNPPELRRLHDFYPTPPHATKALLDRERFSGLILEPACGDGAIVRVLSKHGYDVEATDLVCGQDFFLRTEKVPNIITNPPYRIILDFVKQTKKIATRKIALLLPVEFLHGTSRYELFQDCRFRLKVVYVFASRLRFGTDSVATVGHAWYVWDRRHDGPPTLGWIK